MQKAEPLPESGYQHFAGMDAIIRECYLKEYYNVEFTQKALAAVNDSIRQWDYDSFAYSQAKDAQKKVLGNKASKQECRELELSAQNMIVKIQEHKEALIRQQQMYRENEMMMHQWQMMNRPTTCYTQGNMVRCF